MDLDSDHDVAMCRGEMSDMAFEIAYDIKVMQVHDIKVMQDFLEQTSVQSTVDDQD